MTRNIPTTGGLAWHYTAARYLPSIIESGVLRAHAHPTSSPLGLPVGQAPMLWFSVNQVFEPSIPPYAFGIADLPDEQLQFDILARAIEEAGGSWVRFGYPAHLLFPVGLTHRTVALPVGLTYRTVAPPGWRQIMDDWRVSYTSISVPDCIAIERTDETLIWKRIWTKPMPQLPSLLTIGRTQTFSQ